MIESLSFSDLSRRVANLVRLGKIVEVKDAQVKVAIGKVTTNWLSVLSTAGDINCWIPITAGEQVLVISPYGEISQAVVLRSINYNSFPAPDNKNESSFTSKSDVKANGEGKLEALFTKGFEFNSEDLSIKIADGQIKLTSGSASITVSNDSIELSSESAGISISSNGIKLSCGSSTIDIADNNISLNSASISTMPPVCVCGGGV